MKSLIILLFTFLSFNVAFGQASDELSDINLIIKSQNKPNLESSNYGKFNRPSSIWQKVNPFFWVYEGSVTFYQQNISPQISANCVFATSCSRYSKLLVNHFGVIGGIILSIDRLTRCNRITVAETSPLKFNENGKIIEHIHDYHF